MRSLTAPELLQVWENGLQHSQTDRSLALLQYASSKDDTNPATLSIGQRDARLLQLRKWMFGSKLLNTAVCPSCGEKVEWENDVNDFMLQHSHATSDFQIKVDDFELRFRLPVSADIKQVQKGCTDEENELILLRQCLLEIKRDNEPCLVEDLPRYVLDALEERISKEDAQADITVLLTCPACAHEWLSHFDIQSYLWTEINAWAKNMVQEVYVLARHFGWSEHDILNMSPQRRQLYLQMIFA
ncbi:hypothetical protein QTN47_11745 [Danxiaibacter flavus]|uniref:Phage baseplate protein n=1 Tax=Danxiaibacter flavus TaxID=3049108 RepID=A0ABV3ZID1_9BACT|nr:hypothetical protein QNM32_11750 [Chitinophagaceae bacterium DXS]